MKQLKEIKLKLSAVICLFVVFFFLKSFLKCLIATMTFQCSVIFDIDSIEIG